MALGGRVGTEEQTGNRRQKQRESQGIRPESNPAHPCQSRPGERVSRQENKVTDNKTQVNGIDHHSDSLLGSASGESQVFLYFVAASVYGESESRQVLAVGSRCSFRKA